MQRGNVHVIDQIECIRITQCKHDSLPELVQNVHAKVHGLLYRLIIAGADDNVDAIGCTVCNQFLQFFASISHCSGESAPMLENDAIRSANGSLSSTFCDSAGATSAVRDGT